MMTAVGALLDSSKQLINGPTNAISIARCRELLGEDAESMTDQDIEDIRRHAETMACIVVEMYQDHCRIPE